MKLFKNKPRVARGTTRQHGLSWTSLGTKTDLGSFTLFPPKSSPKDARAHGTATKRPAMADEADEADAPPPPPARGQQVSSLVSAMQSGEISKAELFASLSELKRTPRSPRAGAGDVQRLVGAMRAGKLTKRELMASLAQMKEAQEPVEPPPPPQPDSRDESLSGELREAEMWAELRRDTSSQKPESVDVEVEATSPALSSARRVRQPSPKKPPPPRPKVKPNTRQPYMESTRQLRPRATRDDDCTFRPRVKKLPRKLYPDADRYSRRRDDRDFLTRTQRWASERDEHVRRKSERNAERELDECTFQPRISANSRRSAAVTRSGAATPARLYDEEKQRQLERDTKREMILRKRDEDFDQRHPFQPSMARPRRPRGAIDATQELVTSRVDGV